MIVIDKSHYKTESGNTTHTPLYSPYILLKDEDDGKGEENDEEEDEEDEPSNYDSKIKKKAVYESSWAKVYQSDYFDSSSIVASEQTSPSVKEHRLTSLLKPSVVVVVFLAVSLALYSKSSFYWYNMVYEIVSAPFVLLDEWFTSTPNLIVFASILFMIFAPFVVFQIVSLISEDSHSRNLREVILSGAPKRYSLPRKDSPSSQLNQQLMINRGVIDRIGERVSVVRSDIDFPSLSPEDVFHLGEIVSRYLPDALSVLESMGDTHTPEAVKSFDNITGICHRQVRSIENSLRDLKVERLKMNEAFLQSKFPVKG